MGASSEKVLVERVAEGCGVKYVRVVDPFETKAASAVLRETVKQAGPSVVVFRSPCTLMVLRERRRRGEKITHTKISDKCTGCLVCVKLIGCPAIVLRGKLPIIDEGLCAGCGLCVSVCPSRAIDVGYAQ